jgi:tetratricopeptide (TPR) repeat protein
MELTIILTLLIVAGLILIGFVVWRKLPQVRMIDPTTDKLAASRQKKYEIMKGRLERASGKQIEQINKVVLKPLGTGLQTLVRKLAGKLTAVERQYQAKQKESRPSKYSKSELETLLTEANALVENEEFDRAEKKYIEIISYDAKFVPAYEYLGRLYSRRKDYDLAKETFTFLAKLSPKDASVITSLGEVEEALGNNEAAFEFYKKASALSPKNPKYLDFLIESAIDNENVYEANVALDRLREVNPENQKIADFEERISQIK